MLKVKVKAKKKTIESKPIEPAEMAMNESEPIQNVRTIEEHEDALEWFLS